MSWPNLDVPNTKLRGRPDFAKVDRTAADAFRAVAAGTELDRQSQAPLWLQLKLSLERAIRDGRLAENSRLPSEQAMCNIFALSKPVIRAALGALSADGLVIKQARRGMFVAPRRAEFGFITGSIPLVTDLAARGYEVTERTFEYGLVEPDDDEARVLGLPAGFRVLRIARVFYANGEPLTHTRIALPAHRLPGMENLDLRGRSILETVRQEFGLTVQRADRWITAAIIDANVADRMGLAPGSPILHVRSIGYDFHGLPLEYYNASYNTEVAPIHIATDGMSV